MGKSPLKGMAKAGQSRSWKPINPLGHEILKWRKLLGYEHRPVQDFAFLLGMKADPLTAIVNGLPRSDDADKPRSISMEKALEWGQAIGAPYAFAQALVASNLAQLRRQRATDNLVPDDEVNVWIEPKRVRHELMLPLIASDGLIAGAEDSEDASESGDADEGTGDYSSPSIAEHTAASATEVPKSERTAALMRALKESLRASQERTKSPAAAPEETVHSRMAAGDKHA